MKTKEQTRTIEIYDPVMCCSTGVCGPDVDDELIDFANTVKLLKAKGLDVKRYNLGQEPDVFKSNPEVIARIQSKGSAILPIILLNGEVVSEANYLSREEFQELLGIDLQVAGEAEKRETIQGLMSEPVQELIAIGAALASNCEPCLKYHYKKAIDLGVSEKDIAQTLQIAQRVKDTPAMNMVDLANKLLGVKTQSGNGCAPGSGCC